MSMRKHFGIGGVALQKAAEAAAREVTYLTVRNGMVLVDRHGQECRVERVTGRGRSRNQREVVTRRREGRTYWDTTAVWTPAQFDARRFQSVRR